MTIPRLLPSGNILIRSAPTGEPVEVCASGLGLITQTEWAIDFDAGNDNGDGTLASPLKTGAEFTRRTWGKGFDAPLRLDILSPWPRNNDDYLFFAGPGISKSSHLAIRGASTTTLANGTFTVVNPAVTNTSQATVESSTDLSPFVGKRIRKVAGPSSAPVGTIAYIEAHANEVSTLSGAFFTDTSTPGFWSASDAQNFEVGDSFIVEDVWELPTCYINPFGVSDITGGIGPIGGMVDLQIAVSYDRLTLGEAANGGEWQNVGCIFNTGLMLCQGSIISCRFPNSLGAMNIEGMCFLTGNSFSGDVFTNFRSSRVEWLNTNSIRGGSLVLNRMGFAIINNKGSAGGLSIHEWPAPAALEVGEQCFVNLDGVLWGSSSIANTYGIKVDPGGNVVYLNGRKPTISGALSGSKDVQIGSSSLTYASVPNFNTASGCGIMVKT